MWLKAVILDSADRAHLPRGRKFCQQTWSRWIQSRLVTHEWHCKDVRWNFVLCTLQISVLFEFFFYNYILLGKRTACTCGRCLFLIKISSCILSLLLPVHSGVKGGRVFPKELFWGGLAEMTTVWREHKSERSPSGSSWLSARASLTPFWACAFQSQWTKSVWVHVSRGWSISSFWSFGIWQGQGRHWTGRPTSKGPQGVLIDGDLGGSGGH